MERYKIKTKTNFYAEIDILGSKSITNRALILAALSNKKIILKNPLFSDDTIYMIQALRSLGNEIKISEDKSKIVVFGNKERIFEDKKIFIGNAGTAIRFLTSYISLGKGRVILVGDERMNERPIGELVESLKSLGVEIKYLEKKGYSPIEINANGIKKNFVEISGKNSSQYLSSILMISPYIENGLEIVLNDKVISKPYVNMTIKMMEQFGIKVLEKENNYLIKEGIYSRISEYLIEGDISSSSYFLALALMTNSRIKIKNFILNSLQGDIKILEILEDLGLKIINKNKNFIVVQGTEKYNGFNLNLNDTPDIVPTLSIVALFASTSSTIRDVKSLRVKESDRIKAICNEVKKINGNIIEYKDGFKIIPKKLEEYIGAEIETYNDHRIAMSFSVAGFKIQNIIILNPNCVSKTFPTFYSELDNIYLKNNCGGQCENK